MELLLSGYGSAPSSTIEYYRLNQNSETLLWQSSIEDASFICEGNGYLFTVTEAEDYASVYLLQRSGDGFQLLDERKLEGSYLCHITYSPVNKALFGACYGTGTLFSIRVEEGSFGEVLFHEVQTGAQPGALTRTHCVLLNQDESILIAINIALDLVYFYRIREGRLTFWKCLSTPAGCGPRHAIYSPDEKLIYVITEYSNEILIYENNEQMLLLQKISTLAQDFSGKSNCSTLCFSKDVKYLYAANRGADTIALFAVGEGGTLQWIEEFDCGGKHPRHMIISNDGNYLIVCNQFSDNVSIFELDLSCGKLKLELQSIDFKTPSGVLNIE